ncbi:MAG TPA: alpha/beta hydrolase, partial [Candidatus Paceibacterota bacterium]
MKRVFLIHGWEGSPESNWFVWMKNELEQKGFDVTAPAMPDSMNPKMDAWVSHLAKIVGDPNEETYFIG